MYQSIQHLILTIKQASTAMQNTSINKTDLWW